MSLIAFFSGSLIPAMFVFTVQPPSEVKVAFEHRFANISDLKWHKENNHEYEASFKIESYDAGTHYEVEFRRGGKTIELIYNPDGSLEKA